MKILMVAGTFDNEGGKSSSYMNKLTHALMRDKNVEVWDTTNNRLGPNYEPGNGITRVNGGTYQELVDLVDSIKNFDAVWWFPNVPNDLPKVVKDLKEKIGNKVLVISKNNSSGKYTYLDLVARLFQARANLSLIVETEKPFQMTLLDPLGNVYIHKFKEVEYVAYALYKRTVELNEFTRVGSKSIGEIPRQEPSDEVLKFIDIVKRYANTFHELVHGVHQSRFLGNASFRCTKGAFPAYRGEDNLIYVSQRNLDKREIATDNFIPVLLSDNKDLEYYGDRKPSVDAPIQKELFKRLPWCNYMLHSHVYMEDLAHITASNIPCGALEEVDEIMDIIKWKPDRRFWQINLRGHGCLILGETPEQFENLKFYQRILPELTTGARVDNTNELIRELAKRIASTQPGFSYNHLDENGRTIWTADRTRMYEFEYWNSLSTEVQDKYLSQAYQAWSLVSTKLEHKDLIEFWSAYEQHISEK